MPKLEKRSSKKSNQTGKKSRGSAAAQLAENGVEKLASQNNGSGRKKTLKKKKMNPAKAVQLPPAESYRWAIAEKLDSSEIQEWVDLRDGGVSTLDKIPSPELPDINWELFDAIDATAFIVKATVRVQYHQRDPDFDVSGFVKTINEVLNREDADFLTENPVVHQLIFAELALTVGICLADHPDAVHWLKIGKQNLSVGVEELLDGCGMPAAQWIDRTHLLLACWTRCLWLMEKNSTRWDDSDGTMALQGFVMQAIRLTRKNGSTVFGPCDSQEVVSIFPEIVELVGDEENSEIVKAVFSKQLKLGKKSTPGETGLPECSAHSEWAEVGLLQTGWRQKSPAVAIDFSQRKIRAEVRNGGMLMSGEMDVQLIIGGEPARPQTEWEVVCWNSDDDGDFLELECVLAGDVKWQKQFLLARDSYFLLTADAFLNLNGRTLDFCQSWPLADEVGFGLNAESTEMFLTRNSKSVASILPIGLPEWKTDRSQGSLGVVDQAVVFQANVTGDNAFLPLFIDLDAKRCRKPLTWRQLTVGENLEIVTHDVACGYRVQVAKQQWMIYRSLAPKQNRTVFGQNLAVEYYVADFESDGSCSEIISVE